jgi:CheY-like chemotaxis protein
MPAKILIVDDDDAIRDVLEGLLRREGYEVIGAANGREALAMFASTQLDLVLVDLVLPDVSGLEVARQLRGRSPHTPILMLTGAWFELRDTELLNTAGVDDLLMKPFDRKQLLTKVESMAGLKAYSEELQRVATIDQPHKPERAAQNPGPRAPRFTLHFPVRYRMVGQNDWRTGVTENISRSGLLVRGEHVVEPNTQVEMTFLLPVTSVGDPPAEVTCHAEIVRVAPEDHKPTFGAKILHYRLQRGQQQADA